MCWVDARLRNVDGELGYRTKIINFDDWGSVYYIECAVCQKRFPIKGLYATRLVALMTRGRWFGCDVS